MWERQWIWWRRPFTHHWSESIGFEKRLISISRTCFAWPDLRCIIEAMEEEHGDVDNFILSLQQCRSTLNKVNSKGKQNIVTRFFITTLKPESGWWTPTPTWPTQKSDSEKGNKSKWGKLPFLPFSFWQKILYQLDKLIPYWKNITHPLFLDIMTSCRGITSRCCQTKRIEMNKWYCEIFIKTRNS